MPSTVIWWEPRILRMLLQLSLLRMRHWSQHYLLVVAPTCRREVLLLRMIIHSWVWVLFWFERFIHNMSIVESVKKTLCIQNILYCSCSSADKFERSAEYRVRTEQVPALQPVSAVSADVLPEPAGCQGEGPSQCSTGPYRPGLPLCLPVEPQSPERLCW